MSDLILTHEEQEILDEMDWQEAWDDAQNMIDEECSCWYDDSCPYHAKDRVIPRHELWRIVE